jgi:hypothetical protein
MRNPYITGPYVLGRRHYGRSDLLDCLLHGESHAYWVIGNRRIGKTSLLRQLETLALTDERLLPIFWDMQGCDSIERLGCYLADAIQERLDELLAFGLSVEIVREENVLTLLPALRRTVARAGRELLLLCDETEVLLNIADQEPELAQRLHHELTYGVGQRVVAVSTRTIYQMHEVCRSWPTSPFLAGFDMSQMLGSLDAASALALVVQAQADELVQVEPGMSAAICDLANCHPYLLQLLCARLFQPDGSLRPVDDADLAVDPLLGGFFQNDLSALSDFERQIIWSVFERGPIDEAALAESLSEPRMHFQRPLSELDRLGYLRRMDDRWSIGNRFLVNWLAAEQQKASSEGVREALEPEQLRRQEAAALIEQLNDRRSRLVELEVVRARELLGVSPQVLAEIRQTEDDIRELRATLRAPLNERSA